MPNKGKTLRASDTVEISARSVTRDGYLVAPGVLARTGIQTYLAYELGGIDGLDPMQQLKLYRPPEEVFNPESISSFDSNPITIEHPPQGFVTSDNWQELAKGEVRDIRRGGADHLVGTLTVRSSDAITAIQSGKSQLSNGYTFTLDLTPGVTAAGEAYDGVQRGIRGNHLAIVDSARCGPACRILDHGPKGETNMPDATRKVIVDGIPMEVSDTAAAAIEKLTKERDAAVNSAAAATAKVNFQGKDYNPQELLALAKSQDEKIKGLEKDVMTPAARDAMVAEWVSLAADAKRLSPGLDTAGKTCLDIRKQVVADVTAKDPRAKAAVDAVLPGGMDTATPESMRSAFGVLAALGSPADAGVTNPAGTPATDAVSNALLGNGGSADSGGNQQQGSELVGRDAMLARQRDAFEGKN